MTKAEQTGFKETSTYSDVVQFIDQLKGTHAPIWVTSSGKSFEGKSIPLVIASRPLVHSAAEAKKSGKPIIYIQGNIHAGEVEGKEAALSLLRRYCQEPKGILDKVILMVQPIYNIDGNEKFGPSSVNRPGQTGPDSVGVRTNGQGFDLNRDCIKAESPEMQGALANIYSWSPDVVMDLHTTDGTRHGYPLTYAGPLHPNTNRAIQDYSLGELLSQVRKESRRKYGLELFDYGNGEKDMDGKMYWTTFACEGRYVTNYGGLRNAICVLSEAMVYEPFKERVVATERFVDLCLQKFARDGARIVANHRKADEQVIKWGLDAWSGPRLAMRYQTQLRGTEGVLMEKQVNSERTKRSGPIRDIETVQMPVFDRFKATRLERFPGGYLFSDSSGKLLKLLAMHGVKVERLSDNWLGWGERFAVGKFTQAANPFQGHKLIQLDGEWRGTSVSAAKGDYWVSTAQPLGLLIFDLMEPACIDGATAWGVLGEKFPEGSYHPVQRVIGQIRVAKTVVGG